MYSDKVIVSDFYGLQNVLTMYRLHFYFVTYLLYPNRNLRKQLTENKSPSAAFLFLLLLMFWDYRYPAFLRLLFLKVIKPTKSDPSMSASINPGLLSSPVFGELGGVSGRVLGGVS